MFIFPMKYKIVLKSKLRVGDGLILTSLMALQAEKKNTWWIHGEHYVGHIT